LKPDLFSQTKRMTLTQNVSWSPDQDKNWQAVQVKNSPDAR
jgi:hypothetical protein